MIVAMMTAEEPPRRVIRERHAAVRAHRRVAAVPAEDEGAEPPAVDEQNDLLVPREPFGDRLSQLLSEDGGAPDAKLLAEIEDKVIEDAFAESATGGESRIVIAAREGIAYLAQE